MNNTIMNESSLQTQSQELSSEQQNLTLLNLDQIVDQIALLLQSPDNLDRKEYEVLHAAFYRRKKHIEISGETQDPEQLLLQEARLNDLNQQFRTIERQRNEALVKVQLENGSKVEEALNELEGLLASTEDFKNIYDGFHRIRESWETLRPLTQHDESRLGKRFVALRETFYELKNINTELRDYDFRKNLEEKQALISEMRLLTEEEHAVTALNKLNPLIQRWRDVGPVAKEEREQINGNYKEITTSIFKRHQAYQDSIKEREEQNTQLKEDIISRVQALITTPPQTANAWNVASEDIKKLQEEWRQIGRASKKHNTELYTRFRAVCDQFFQEKQGFYKERKAIHSEAISKRKSLIEQATSLASSQEFGKTAEALTALQEEWKKLPHLRKEEGDALWEEFRKPFNEFYQRKREHDRKQHNIEHSNEQRKRSLLEELRALANESELPEKLKDKLTSIKESWKKIGRASAKVNDNLWEEFCKLNDTLYDRLRQAQSKRLNEQVKARHQKLSEQPHGVRDELQFLNRKVERLRAELRNYDNNLNFLSSSSKDASNPLLKEVERKRNKLAQDLAHVEEELRLMQEAEKSK